MRLTIELFATLILGYALIILSVNAINAYCDPMDDYVDARRQQRDERR